jgi:CheY-like chemotaxis protein
MDNRKNKKILVVDDDANLLDLLVDTLTAVGYEAIPAPGGVEALEALTQNTFDLIVTDIKMPDVDGISLLKKVRRYYPDLPVLFITGVATPDIIASANPDGFLAKPFRISHIEDLIESTLNRELPVRPQVMKKILVVDEDSDFREMLSEALTVSQYIPFAVPNGADALREIQNGEFDAVITDMVMPDMESLSFLREVKEQMPEVPVILTGADVLEQSSEPDTEPLPYDRYLQKPYNAGDVIALLKSVSSSTTRH